MNHRQGYRGFPFLCIFCIFSLFFYFMKHPCNGCVGTAIWMLIKRMAKKLDGNYTRMLRAVLNKSWWQYPIKQQLYGHLSPITKTIQVRRIRHAGHCWRSKDELISDILLWIPSQSYSFSVSSFWVFLSFVYWCFLDFFYSVKMFFLCYGFVSSDDYLHASLSSQSSKCGVTVRIQDETENIVIFSAEINL